MNLYRNIYKIIEKDENGFMINIKNNKSNKNIIKNIFIYVFSVLMILSLVGCGKKEEEEEEEYVRASVIGEINENTVKLSPNGTLLEISCEDFAGSDIDTASLEEYINSEIDEYNKNAGVSKISLVEFQEEDGVVKTAIQYSDVYTYNSFNMMELDINLYDPDKAYDIMMEDMATATDANQIVMTSSPTEINVEELAEAGYDLSEIEAMENGTYEEETASTTDAQATFTDATSLNDINAEDITGASYMMLVTNEAYTYVVNGGNILYYDKHAELIDSTSVKTDGKGKSIIVYSFNY